jgi:olefin beta-lactone synthetase
MLPEIPVSERLNIADRLRESARLYPQQVAVAAPRGGGYDTLTFAELDEHADRIAAGLAGMGVVPGTRLVLMVRPGLAFVTLVFALFRAGAVVVLIDPGMGRTNIFDCLQRVEPEGFVAIPIVHVLRLLKRRRFPRARFNVTVGRRWGWGGVTYRQLLEARLLGRSRASTAFEPPAIRATDPAAIIFTSGSTGPPKGVLYEHGMFDAQVDLLREQYGIEPGEIDLPGFPLFALFNAAMGVTTVVPDMDPTRPANVDPVKIVKAIGDWHVTQAFGSPAMWNTVGRHCEAHGVTFPTLRRILSAGAPVPNHVLERMSRTLVREGAEMFTPYGATEALPVASIGAREVLSSTADETRRGRGTCVGRAFPGVRVRIVAITDGPIGRIEDATELPANEIGEILVQGPSVTRRYLDDAAATERAKVADVGRVSYPSFWHRMGDVGYLDAAGRLWFCGRRAHIVETANGRMFTIPCEAILNEHPRVYRTALVGLGEKPRQRPVVVVEPEPGRFPEDDGDATTFRDELRAIAAANPLTASIETFLFHRSLPVDTGHNVKINREALAVWAAERPSR